MLLHSVHVALLDVISVLDLELGLSLRRLLLRLAHLHRGDHLLGAELALFLLKISLFLSNDVLRKSDIRAFLALKVHSRSHLALLTYLPGALHSLKLLLFDPSISLV